MRKNKNQKVEKIMSEIDVKIGALLSEEAQTFQDYLAFETYQLEFPAVYQGLEKKINRMGRQGVTQDNVKERFPATTIQKLQALASILRDNFLLEVIVDEDKRTLKAVKKIGLKYSELKPLGFSKGNYNTDTLARNFSTQLLCAKQQEAVKGRKVPIHATVVEIVRNTLISFSIQLTITRETLDDTDTLLLYLTELDKIDTQYKGGFVKIQVEMGVE